MGISPAHIFLCNGALLPEGISTESQPVVLDYDPLAAASRINLKLPRFVDQLYHLPDRVLDLLELAAYVFAADRATLRGSKTALEFHLWPRRMHFYIRVREVHFWTAPQVTEKLSAALQFMTGDAEYVFNFLPGHATPPSSLFDRKEFAIAPPGPSSVVLFSGGLDSLTGTLERLRSSDEVLYLISHQSGQPSTKKTQNGLVAALNRQFPGRVLHYAFECGLSHQRAVEETQRTRAFLFASIAFALAQRLSLSTFYAYENGVTSMNFARRQDLMNARASRTTHPRTHALLSALLSEVLGGRASVSNPFWHITKSDVFSKLDHYGGRNLIGSAVSCSKTFRRLGSSTHCGACFQCIDRRLAAYSSGLSELDDVGIYSTNVFTDTIDDPEAKTTIVDYVRQALGFLRSNNDAFAEKHLLELSYILDAIDAGDEDPTEVIWDMCRRHGEQVNSALLQIRTKYDDLRVTLRQGSLLQLMASREHLKADPRRLAEAITETLKTGLPLAFKNDRPKDERVLNDHIESLLRAHQDRFRREFPTTQYALANVIPDFEALDSSLTIEGKYLRGATTPAKASEGIAADLVKYPPERFLLFVVYDPDRCIRDDEAFANDFQHTRPCLISVIR